MQNPLRFDHREIAVIFSLFVFVSLLMFTVGILVGKGLAQARYENLLAAEAERLKLASQAPFSPQNVITPGTSISYPQPTNHPEQPKPDEKKLDSTELVKKDARLELIPAEPGSLDGLKEPIEDNKAVSSVLANPKLQNIFEAEQEGARHPSSQIPKSFARGAYTVQVGSYPAQKDAEERVRALQKLGFPHAFFSAKQIQGRNDTWFRVWLGFFPDEAQARLAGQSLKDRGEVKDYLVREADKVTAKN